LVRYILLIFRLLYANCLFSSAMIKEIIYPEDKEEAATCSIIYHVRYWSLVKNTNIQTKQKKQNKLTNNNNNSTNNINNNKKTKKNTQNDFQPLTKRQQLTSELADNSNLLVLLNSKYPFLNLNCIIIFCIFFLILKVNINKYQQQPKAVQGSFFKNRLWFII